MCGRYFLGETPDTQALWQIIAHLNRAPKGDIAPTDWAPVRTSAGLLPMRWGFPWEKNRVIINARSETAQNKPLFSDSLAHRRIAIPASGFYEWKRCTQGRKNKYRLSVPDRPLAWMAGLYQEFPVQHGVEARFVILTAEANSSVAPIHSRMPVYLLPGREAHWIAQGGTAALDTHLLLQAQLAENEQLSFLS